MYQNVVFKFRRLQPEPRNLLDAVGGEVRLADPLRERAEVLEGERAGAGLDGPERPRHARREQREPTSVFPRISIIHIPLNISQARPELIW